MYTVWTVLKMLGKLAVARDFALLQNIEWLWGLPSFLFVGFFSCDKAAEA
jgi:hypothetical protein